MRLEAYTRHALDDWGARNAARSWRSEPPSLAALVGPASALLGSYDECSFLYPDLEHPPKVEAGGPQPSARKPHFRDVAGLTPSAGHSSAPPAVLAGMPLRPFAPRVPLRVAAELREGALALWGQAVAEAVVVGAGRFRQGCRLTARSTHEVPPLVWARARRRLAPLSCPLMGFGSRGWSRLHALSMAFPSVSSALVALSSVAAARARVKSQKQGPASSSGRLSCWPHNTSRQRPGFAGRCARSR